MPTIGRRALDPNEPFVSVLGAYKQFCQNAGIGDPKQEQKSAERFVITINLGADTEKYDKSIAIDPNDISPEPNRYPVLDKK